MTGIAHAIDLAGGPAAFARGLGVTVQAVCFWRDGKRAVPLEQCPYIERLVGRRVTCEQLRPDKLEYFELMRQRNAANDSAAAPLIAGGAHA